MFFRVEQKRNCTDSRFLLAFLRAAEVQGRESGEESLPFLYYQQESAAAGAESRIG